MKRWVGRTAARVGLADLVVALSDAGPSDAELDRLAELLGYTYDPVDPDREPAAPDTELRRQGWTPIAPVVGSADRPASLRMLWAVRAAYADRTTAEEETRRQTYEKLDLSAHVPGDPNADLEDPDWFPWSRMEHRVLSAVGVRRRARAVDGPRLLRVAARLRPLTFIPRRTRMVWPREAAIFAELGPRVRPFAHEMWELGRRLGQAPPLERTQGQPAQRSAPGVIPAARTFARYGRRVPAGSTGLMVAVRDAAGPDAPTPSGWWLWVLGLDGVMRRSSALGTGEDDSWAGSLAERLLVALAPAIQVEAGLLRLVAFENASSGFTARTVLEAWNHPWVDRGDTSVVAWRTAPRTKALEAWARRLRDDRDPDALERRALRTIAARHKAHHAPSLWLEERAAALALIDADDPLRPWLEEDHEDAARFYRGLKMVVHEPEVGGWLRSVVHRNPMLLKPEHDLVGDGVNPLRVAYEALELGLRPDELPEEQVFSVVAGQEGLCLRAAEGAPDSRLVGEVRTTGLDFTIELQPGQRSPLRAGVELGTFERTDAATGVDVVGFGRRALDALGAENPWAKEVGEDEYGVWADVEVAGVRFRMRWIPPGTFWMGSPKDEEGRWEDEGPIHEVTLTEGYWMADAPCTQALWTAVMGENPSRGGQGPEHPVDTVSWDDVQTFLARVSSMAPGLELGLPTEAQWERACRGGTQTPTYAGAHDATTLDAIAWYTSNAGGFTQVVRGKRPNGFGLYDTLGNVLEWCQDFWEDAHKEHQQIDPTGPPRGAERVVRGGSWYLPAGLCRAACRRGLVPGYRLDDLGFRVSRGQALDPRDAGRAERAERAPERPRDEASVPRPRFYLSYAKDDRAVMQALRDELYRTLGEENVFVDESGISQGENWRDTLDRGWKAADIVVALVSRAALGSKWVRRELERALDSDRVVVPVFLEQLDGMRPDMLLAWLRAFRGYHLDRSALPTGLAELGQVLVRLWRSLGGDGQAGSEERGASVVGATRSGLDVALVLRTDRSRLELEAFERPDWAHGVGRDRFGLFADLRPKGWAPEAWLKLRWIPPGTFWMGSPKDEPGHKEDEGPRHRVTLSQGFWLADAPCTQALWTQVMGRNPSRFQSRTEPWLSHLRPVEQVSWEDVQAFLQRLQEVLPGAQLPTEAEWEYACRAGSETATYAGPVEILGEANAPALDDIAWYRGNSGVDYELDEAWDSSDWDEKQYPHERAGTRVIRTKRPNAWGLYDMLGNVWEWCQDARRRTYGEARVTDPLRQNPGPERVIRGGSWHDPAGSCRAAFRGGDDPGLRGVNLGFRVSRGLASVPRDAGPSSERSEPSRAEPEGGAEQRGAPSTDASGRRP